MTTPTPSRGYLPGLDGLRALAVVAVIAYHFGLEGVPGGFLGVDVFFVLSGYLITSHLWVRSDALGRFDLQDFWVRRVRRLLPAVVALVATCALALLVLDRAQGRSFLGDAAAALTYTSNWWYVLHQRSYFEASGRPPVLQHLWSLAVEEQFYLVWPLVLLAVARVVPAASRRRRLLRTLATAGAGGSLLLMAVGTAVQQLPQNGDVSRWYFGSDSHAFGLLAGAALAFHRGGAGFRADRPLRRATLRDTRAGWLALLVVGAMLVGVDAWTPWLYRVGFAVLTFAMTVLVAVAARPGPFARLVGARPLALVGQRSYGLYLWHWPVACFTRPQADVPLDGLPLLLLRVMLTVLLTEICYRFVEVPFRRDGIRATLARLAGPRLGSPPVPLAAVGAGVVVVGVAGALALATPPAADVVATTAPPVAAPTALPTPTAAPTAVPSSGAVVAAQRRIVVYGDSVALGAEPGLRKAFKTVDSKATEGVQARVVLDALLADAAAGRTEDAVVLVHVGDNGPIDQGQLVRALQSAEAARVILVRPRVPREWQQRNLDVVDAAAAQAPGVRVLDWYGASSGKKAWYADSVHLQTPGVAAYAATVRDLAEAP